MKILTLTTDWNNDDYYKGMVKGFLVSNSPEITIVEISHNIPIFDIKKARFTIKSCFNHFPKNTIHIVSVRGFKKKQPAPPIAVKYDDYWFFGYDNGAFLQIFEQNRDLEVWYLNSVETTFPELDLLIKPAVQLLNGIHIESLGIKDNDTTPPLTILPHKLEHSLIGVVIYINGYGNAITNITRSDFEECRKNRQFKITLLKQQNSISKISNGFDEQEGELVAIFNSLNLLELGQMNYRLDQSIGLDLQSKIRIQFL